MGATTVASNSPEAEAEESMKPSTKQPSDRLSSPFPAKREQKFHADLNQLVFAVLISTAFIVFIFCRQYIRAEPSTDNGFLQELHKSEPLNKSESLEYYQTSLQPAGKVSANRKLLASTERMGDACTSADIVILQGETGPLPDGIPSFMVQIVNLCVAGCPISDIHVACGWFASTKLIDPKLFKRVKFNDCVVNNKLPLKGGDSIVFEYANSFQYPLEIVSANACCW